MSLEPDAVLRQIDNRLDMGKRVNKLEGRMLVMETVVENLNGLPEIITDMRIFVAGMSRSSTTQARITWGLLIAILSGLIGFAWKILQSGGVP